MYVWYVFVFDGNINIDTYMTLGSLCRCSSVIFVRLDLTVRGLHRVWSWCQTFIDADCPQICSPQSITVYLTTVSNSLSAVDLFTAHSDGGVMQEGHLTQSWSLHKCMLQIIKHKKRKNGTKQEQGQKKTIM